MLISTLFLQAPSKKETAAVPKMMHFPSITKSRNMTRLKNTAARAWIKTIVFSTVPGKEMQGGLLKIDIGPSLQYTLW